MITFKQLFTSVIGTISLVSITLAGDPPKVLGDYMDQDVKIKAEVVKMEFPKEFFKFKELLEKAEAKDPEWFKEHLAKSAAENPIPSYDAKLGMTQAEYDSYVKLWEKRKYNRVDDGEVEVMLIEQDPGEWVINVSGKGMPVSLIKYIEKSDTFKSSNGEMKRIEDIKMLASSVYREWNGHEWRYFNEGSLVKTKENFAIGRTGDKRYGIMIYSLQEISGEGQILADDLLIIRFVPNKVK